LSCRSRGNEAQIPSAIGVGSKPPHVGSYFFNGLLTVIQQLPVRLFKRNSNPTATRFVSGWRLNLDFYGYTIEKTSSRRLPRK
ncbi:MAG: hypothetical protein WBN75_07500, partial [Verrucomicrobiia bacterium]